MSRKRYDDEVDAHFRSAQRRQATVDRFKAAVEDGLRRGRESMESMEAIEKYRREEATMKNQDHTPVVPLLPTPELTVNVMDETDEFRITFNRGHDHAPWPYGYTRTEFLQVIDAVREGWVPCTPFRLHGGKLWAGDVNIDVIRRDTREELRIVTNGKIHEDALEEAITKHGRPVRKKP